MTKSHGPLYAMGGAHPNAMKGLATGARDGKPAEREQTVYTPASILQVVAGTWPEGIALDPCGGPEGLVVADEMWVGRQFEERWRDRSYINSPYKNLKWWLAKSEAERELGVTEQILLFPVRTNRIWWMDYMRECPSVVAWLKPLTFLGYTQAFPAPLVLVYLGARTALFREAVTPLSTFVGGCLR